MTAESNQEKLHFQAEVKQLLHIVVHSLYSNKEIFLRELISNASDAADKLRFEALSDSGLYDNDSHLAITITTDKENKTLTISDNGIGMTREEIVQHLGTIAKSGTKEFLAQLSGDQKKDSHLIGQFGVGFYSAFIVADQVTVDSRRAGMEASHAVRWTSKGDGDYTVETIDKPQRGTSITLHLKEAEEEFLDDWRLKSIITKYSDHINMPIMLPKKDEDGNVTGEFEQINRATALWSLPKSQIKPEEYNEFYKHIAHDFEDPLVHTHHRVEGGNIEYTCLLYVPQKAPFDLWNRDKHYGLKLYVQRVFIMDNVEQFLPSYLRFVKGVLDTTALPLNVSREILQDHASITKLKSALVRHILDLLDKLVKNDPEKYQLFWDQFGNVLKEGPAEDYANRDRIAKLLRFTSTHSKNSVQSVSLADYISRMKEKQQKIYYITADSLPAAKSSPQLEIFNKNNIEVLLLTDKIDEWVVTHLTEFEGKALQSVAKGDLELDELLDQDEESKIAEAEKEKSQQQAYESLLKQMKTVLDEHVADVKLSHRLTTSPACLVRDQNAMGAQMEKLLKAAGQDVGTQKPLLEVNPDHAILQKLRDGVDAAKLQEWTQILFDQAVIAEGGQLKDPASFVQRINKLWLEMMP